MKYFSLLICAALFFVCLNGCAGNRTKLAAHGKSKKNKPTFAQTLAAEFTKLARSPIRTTVESRREPAQMGKDSSITRTMYDAFGNKTESRIFYNDLLLKMVVLRTSANGQKEALVYGQNGEVKIAPQNLLDKVLTSVSGEIAQTVEIFDGRRENEMLARLNAPQVAPTEDFSMLNLNPAIAETETATEQTAAESETVAPPKAVENATEAKTVQTEDSALKLRAVVQSLKPVKKIRSEFSNKDTNAEAN